MAKRAISSLDAFVDMRQWQPLTPSEPYALLADWITLNE